MALQDGQKQVTCSRGPRPAPRGAAAPPPRGMGKASPAAREFTKQPLRSRVESCAARTSPGCISPVGPFKNHGSFTRMVLRCLEGKKMYLEVHKWLSPRRSRANGGHAARC